MQSVQLQSLETDYPQPERSFYMRLSEGVADNWSCYIAKGVSGILVLIGLVFMLNGAIQEAKREDKIEELIYRKNEDEEIFDEATPLFTPYQKLTTSDNQKRMIVRAELRKKWKRDRRWRRKIERELATNK